MEAVRHYFVKFPSEMASEEVESKGQTMPMIIRVACSWYPLNSGNFTKGLDYNWIPSFQQLSEVSKVAPSER